VYDGSMTKLNDLVKYLDDYLAIGDIKDDSWNGLQVEGALDVKKVAAAVDAGVQTIEGAKEAGAQMLIVHHGLFWQGVNPAVKGMMSDRVRALFDNKISLYACHLPLDRHKEIGNNALLLKMLGVGITGEFSVRDGVNTSWQGERSDAVGINELVKILDKELLTASNVLPFGKEEIKTVAVCSGGAGHEEVLEAIENKVDLYVTGEHKDIYQLAKDGKLNVIQAGHNATETLGVKAVGELLKREFGLENEFVEAPTGL